MRDDDWAEAERKRLSGEADRLQRDGFCIDTADENCPVYLFGPHNDAMAAGPDEEGFFELLSADFKEWVDNLVSNCG